MIMIIGSPESGPRSVYRHARILYGHFLFVSHNVGEEKSL